MVASKILRKAYIAPGFYRSSIAKIGAANHLPNKEEETNKKVLPPVQAMPENKKGSAPPAKVPQANKPRPGPQRAPRQKEEKDLPEWAPIAVAHSRFHRAAKALDQRIKEEYSLTMTITEFEKIVLSLIGRADLRNKVHLSDSTLALLRDYQEAKKEKLAEILELKASFSTTPISAAVVLPTNAAGLFGAQPPPAGNQQKGN